MSCSTALIGESPSLDRENAFRSPRPCKICDGPAVYFDSVDFNKFCDVDDYFRFGESGIFVKYLRCLSCNFIFTEDFDSWRTEDFAARIYNSDYVKVDGDYVKLRPELYAKDFAARFKGCENARILDYGSGAGVFVDRMRGYGYAGMKGYDPFSSPSRPAGRFDIVTCFEVIEHSCDPVGALGDMMSLMRPDGCIIFSQTVQPPDILAVRGSWWYLAPRNGHVSTYSVEALVELGRRHGLVLHAQRLQHVRLRPSAAFQLRGGRTRLGRPLVHVLASAGAPGGRDDRDRLSDRGRSHLASRPGGKSSADPADGGVRGVLARELAVRGPP